MNKQLSMEQLVVGATQLKGPNVKAPYTVSGKHGNWVWLTHPGCGSGIIRSFSDLVYGDWQIYSPHVDIMRLETGAVIYNPFGQKFMVVYVHRNQVWLEDSDGISTYHTIYPLSELNKWTYTR